MENFDNVKPYNIKENSAIVAKKKEIHDFFMSPARMDQLRKSLPRVGVTADRMVRILFSSIAQNPKLANCTTKSLFNAMIQCAQSGIEPNTALGHAYIIPYGNTATLIIGYKGLIELCRRSKEFSSIYAHEVYPGDEFEIQLGTSPNIKHVPKYGKEYDPQDILGCYAVVKFKDNTYAFEYMPKHEIDKIRKRSKASSSGPWVTDYIQMARKTVIKRIMHYQPLTIELAEAIKIDGENEAGIDSFNIDIDDITDDKKNVPDEKDKKQKVDSSKKEHDAKKNQIIDTDNMLISLHMHEITEEEICAYFMVDKLSQIDTQQIKELESITSDIESGKKHASEFKKTAKERNEIMNEGKKE